MTIYSNVFTGTLVSGGDAYGNVTNVDSGSLTLNISFDAFDDVVGSGTLTDTSVYTVPEPPQYGNIVSTNSGSDTETAGGGIGVLPPGFQVGATFSVAGLAASFGGDFNNAQTQITGTIEFSDGNIVPVTLYGQPALPPVISFDSGSLRVNANAKTATYTLSRGPVPLGDIGSSVYVSTSNGTAVAGVDYGAVVNKLVVFSAGQTTATFTVPIYPDSADAAAHINPDFELVLSNPTNATIGFGAADTTIVENPPPVATVLPTTATARPETVAASTLVSGYDPVGNAITEYRLWDTGTSGAKLTLGGTVEPAQTNITLSPSQFASLTYTYGATNTSDVLWAEVYDGSQWSVWASATENGFVDHGPIVTPKGSNFPATRGQSFAVTTFFTASDPDGDSVTEYAFWDTGGGGRHFLLNNVAQGTNAEIDVAAGQLSQLTYQSGSGADTLWVRAYDGTVWGAWSNAFTVAVPPPTASAHNNPTATGGQAVALSSLVTITDPGNAGYQTLELWDSNGTLAGGQFVVNGVAQTGGHEISVSPANVANTVFHAGSSGGTDILWVQLQLNDGSVTGWQQFAVTVPNPTMTVHNDLSATGGQVINLSSLVTISDHGGVSYQKLELWDSDGTVTGGQFVVNGAAQTGGHEIDVSPANVANTVFDASTSGGNDTLWAQLQLNNGNVTGWQQFNVTVSIPKVTVHNDANATGGQQIALSTLLTIADPGGVGYQKLELWDSNGTVASGQFVVNGAAQTGGHQIDVSPSNIANTVFHAGTSGGNDTLWAQLQLNDGSVTGWQQFNVTVPIPKVTVHNDANATGGQQIALSTLLTIADPGGVGYQKLELWDSNGTVASGEFVVNGAAQTGGHEIDVSPANVANTVFDASTLGGNDILWAQLQLNNGNVTGWQQFNVIVPIPKVTVHNDASATGSQHIALSTLLTIADPSGVGYQKLELWDSNGTVAGGQFVVNGAAQTGGHEIDVSPANVANTVFDAGSSGGNDILWAQLQLNDGSVTGWQQFNVTVPIPKVTVHNFTTATPGQVINLSSLVTIADSGGVGYQKLELWDSNGTATGGQFKVNGAAQTGGHEIDVSPANVANTVFDAGSSGGNDILWAQLQLNDGSVTGWQQFQVVDPVTVDDGATLELASAYAGHAIFAGATGTLQLDNSAGFSGTVAGFTGQDTLDLRDIGFATSSSPTYSGDSSGGTLSITDGTHTANIALLGNYMASTFVASSDGHGGTSIVDPPAAGISSLSPPQHA